MAYLVSAFWFWLLLALVLGLAVGWMTCAREGHGWRGLMPWLAILVIGGLIAWSRILPGRLGLWFDLGMLLLSAYLVGCALGCLMRQLLGIAEPVPQRVAAPVPRPLATSATPREVAVEPMKPSAVSMPEIEAEEAAITGLSAPRNGGADDLKRIYGVDGETEAKLNALGLFHYDQIAGLTPANRRWLFRHLGYEGRFPSWWWRWRFDAEQLMAGRSPTLEAAAPVAIMAAAPEPQTSPPKPATAPSGDATGGSKPVGLATPRGGKADDLKRIRGIGKQNEGRLHGLGIWHFDQIAAWSGDEAAWVGGYLAFPGRIEREDWIGQAKILAAGQQTAFSKRVDSGDVATSRDDANDDGQGNIAVLGTDFGGANGSGKPKPPAKGARKPPAKPTK